MNGKYILTHDLETSGNKAVLFDLKLNALYQTKVNYPIYYPKRGWVEQEPEDFWNSVIKATHTLIHENNINPDDIIGLIFRFASLAQSIMLRIIYFHSFFYQRIF